MRAIIYTYSQESYINIPADRAETDDDFVRFYSGGDVVAMIALTDLKGFYFSRKG